MRANQRGREGQNALKLLFGTKNNQLHDYLSFLQNDSEVSDLTDVPPAQPMA